MIRILLALLFSISVYGQECSPYHPVNNWEANDDVDFTVSWVSCFHAAGLAFSMDYNNISGGVHIMGEGHDNSAYTFLSYQYEPIKNIKVSAGPLYRLNNEGGLMIGQFGADIKLYRSIWLTSRILQINRNLNYLNVGVKIVL
jgi:hypothetical protein|tara:strand:+ start:1954 stop:2382 length:429 start_codon:yes stop_codon:yes gene_type:complete